MINSTMCACVCVREWERGEQILDSEEYIEKAGEWVSIAP